MNTDDVWLKAVNMGDIVNAKGHELFPFVFKDGKYFIDTISQDISWVITEILDNYRK